jgi:hypothetical protein
MEKIFLKIREMRLEFPGLTIGLVKLQPVFSGWVVKVKEGQNLEGEDGMEEAVKIALETTRTISGWKDEETELWDVVEIFETEEEATEAGKQNGQMSIYQIETGKLKWLD